MKRIDKLILGSFIGPFLLTLVVVDFILLLVTLLKYFDQIMGKGLSASIFGELIFYFSISSSPDAFPLAILLSSIMTFGNLGEHSELTAVKSSGISLLRALVPIFIFVLALTGFTYYSNTRLVPKTNLETYSLLWDMRTKKPALDIKQGVFYDGIPGYTIKVNDKIDDENLKDIIIYDHRDAKGRGNKIVILADSGRMYSFKNQRYMALELFKGSTYREQMEETFRDKSRGGTFSRESFETMKIVFDLSSFDMNSTDQRLFRRSRLVQTRADLIIGVDSMHRDILVQQEKIFRDVASSFKYHFVKNEDLTPDFIKEGKAYYDSLRMERQRERFGDGQIVNAEDSVKTRVLESTINQTDLSASTPTATGNKKVLGGQTGRVEKPVSRLIKPSKRIGKTKPADNWQRIETHFRRNRNMTSALVYAQNNTRAARNSLNNRITSLKTIQRDQNKFIVTKNQQVARSFACLIMFLIGAPIGAIIKKGGIGLPVVISIIFFLLFYIMNTVGEKLGKEAVLDPAIAVWISNAVLLPFGLFFLHKARNDARIFEADFYLVWLEKIKNLFRKKKILQTT